MVAAAMRTIYAQPDADHVARPVRRDRLHARPSVPRRRHDPQRRPRRRARVLPRSPKRTGARSGPPTRSNASTVRSNAAPASSASSPTTPRCCASSARSSPRPTTNGKTPNVATSPNTPWPCSTSLPPSRSTPRRSCLQESRPDTPRTRHADVHARGSYTTRGDTAQAGPSDHVAAVLSGVVACRISERRITHGRPDQSNDATVRGGCVGPIPAEGSVFRSRRVRRATRR